jgi:cytochrome c oxidase accessory protein FixG
MSIISLAKTKGAGSEPALAGPSKLVQMAQPVADNGEGDGPLYAARRKIYPQSVSGTYRRLKWIVLLVTLGIYYGLPFVRWDRGPNAPDQAVLVDLPGRRFYFFFIELWPQEVYYFTGLLVLAALTLFLMNAVAGRIWCGHLCPQTVWTDLFQAVERLVEGDRREHIQRDNGPWTAERLARAAVKHFLWLMIAWWTGGAWVLYFADAPTLVWDLATFQAPLIAYMWIGILTLTTYAFAGLMREQVCLYMCPWPRIQAALTDEHALNVTYRYDRGEPRNSLKKSLALRELGETVGDCIDCLQCVHVCPTGVDIRGGANLGCIQCGLCIDACDAVMAKIGRPARLIAYDTDLNIKRRQEGQPQRLNIIRARTVLYAVIIALVGSIMLHSLATRTSESVAVIHDRNPVFVRMSSGAIRNGFTVRIINKRLFTRDFSLTVSGLPQHFVTVEVLGITKGGEDRWAVIEVGPDQTREIRVLVTDHDAALPPSTKIGFHIVDLSTGDSADAWDFFRSP